MPIIVSRLLAVRADGVRDYLRHKRLSSTASESGKCTPLTSASRIVLSVSVEGEHDDVTELSVPGLAAAKADLWCRAESEKFGTSADKRAFPRVFEFFGLSYARCANGSFPLSSQRASGGAQCDVFRAQVW